MSLIVTKYFTWMNFTVLKATLYSAVIKLSFPSALQITLVMC